MGNLDVADRDIEGWDPYLDWSRQLLRQAPWRSVVTQGSEGHFLGAPDGQVPRPGDGGQSPPASVGLFEPIFVRVKSDLSAGAFFELLQQDRNLLFEPMERAIAENRPEGEPIEIFLYARLLVPRARHYYEVLHVGSPVAIDETVKPVAYQLVPAERQTDKVALGIIDDGICYLNRRFTRPDAGTGRRVTRFLAFWQQGLAGTQPFAPTLLGRISDETRLNQLLADPAGEAEIYRRENALVYPAGVTRTNEQAASHGTHLLDLAAGGADLDALPLIGVQLPPDAVDDTSGTRLEIPVLQALRWMILTARVRRIRHLVVNISLGILAGPKDGSMLIEQQMRREVELAAMPALGTRVEVELVLPFGSEYETRQVAELCPQVGKDAEVGLCLQRDDRAASFVEIRPQVRAKAAYDTELADLSVSLVAPDGTMFGPFRPGAGRAFDIAVGGVTVGRFYRTLPRPGVAGGPEIRSYLALAFAPTMPLAPETGTVPTAGWRIAAPPGRWLIRLASAGAAPGPVAVQVQRGDTAVGYRITGRQARLDADPVDGWNTRDRDYTGLGSGAIRHEGTNNAYATSGAPRLHAVGSARIGPGPGGLTRAEPAAYASQGAGWTVAGPDAAAPTETGHLHAGLNAVGSFSGSAAHFVGSSTAAASYSRSLARTLLGSGALGGVINITEQARLGARSVTENPAIRARGT